MKGCRLLAWENPRLNVEVIIKKGCDEDQPHKVYVYRSVAWPRRDAPPDVLTLCQSRESHSRTICSSRSFSNSSKLSRGSIAREDLCTLRVDISYFLVALSMA
ncbi:hypothetical protein SASPL_123973 [Salvia splendens]|uniref:Uncharacterized protein n=1 Tax=Salvia splendens TaxID=180675 RepID=A0A8X8XM02_SALSN|nr:hypothetical protein SASPL_123973 [Salvia splendens]